MRKQIIDLMVEWLKVRGVEIVPSSIRCSKPDFIKGKTDQWLLIRLRGENGGYYEIVTILDSEELKQKWYRLWMFDGSMDKKDKEALMLEYPIEPTFKERFPHQFEIDGMLHRFKCETWGAPPIAQ